MNGWMYRFITDGLMDVLRMDGWMDGRMRALPLDELHSYTRRYW
jgi:hypothetical protein